jgi:transposase
MLKTLKIKLKPSKEQKKVFDEWFDTTTYIYNKTLECINKNEKKALDFNGLRDLLVTNETKKNNNSYDIIIKELKKLEKYKKLLDENYKNNNSNFLKIKIELVNSIIQDLKNKKRKLPIEKNQKIREWELKTPKEIRAGSVNDVCKAFKTGFANLKNGNIKFFNMKYKKKDKNNKCFLIPKTMIKNNNGNIKIASSFFKQKNISCNFKMGKKTIKKHKNIEVNHDCRIVKQNYNYFLFIPVSFKNEDKKNLVNYCGIDPGIRTFMTSFGNNGFTEYEYDNKYINSLDSKINTLKNRKNKTRMRKRKLIKIENRKSYLIDELHWKTINHITKNNDVIFYGDIKSHNIVKKNNNKNLNKNTNNLKFFTFKQRLLFKALERHKKVFEINECYTTKTCSFCGIINEPGISKVYECKSCLKKVGRDINASKNILMKGIITFL